MKVLTTFPTGDEFDKAKARFDRFPLSVDIISPDPGYDLVGVAALAMESEARAQLAARGPGDLFSSGWVDYRPAAVPVPSEPPRSFAEDVFGRAAIMVLAPCVADATKIRIIARISGDLTEVFPYLNAEMKQACYNVNGPTFTFMDGYRMISMYAHRIAVAKADEIVDAWRTLEMIRCRVNEVWARRGEIEPCYEMREKPPALEIFKRLPRTNCGQCGELTCLAFAVKVHGGDVSVSDCSPVFERDFGDLREALLEVCRGLGVAS